MKISNQLLASKSALVGFDGFIDVIYRIINGVDSFQNYHFQEIDEFGTFIKSKNQKNFSLGLTEIQQKIGGNAVIFTKAISNLGLPVHLISSLGAPKIHPIFQFFSENITYTSFAEPGKAMAFEFNDGKMMLYENGILGKINWKKLKEIIGFKALIKYFKDADLISLLNWSEIIGMTSVLEGILLEILPNINAKNKIIFFDLADCSQRKKEDILKILEIIKGYSNYGQVILSLNKNEAETLHSTIFGDEIYNDKNIYNYLKIPTLLIHNSVQSSVYQADKVYSSNTFFVEKPFISTGAGDHFNAGFCAALMSDIPLEKCLIFANTVANIYINTGQSPNWDETSQFINSKKNSK